MESSDHAGLDPADPHPHALIGGLEIAWWLFLRPSVWRRHVAGIDSTLRPNFCLAELSGPQWRHPALRRLLLKAAVAWPVLVVALSSVVLTVWGSSAEHIGRGVLYGLLLGSAGTLLVGTVVSVAGGFAGGVVISMAFSLAFATALQVGGGVAPLIQGLERVGVAASVAGGVAGVVNLGPVVGTIISVVVGIAGSLAGTPATPGLVPSWSRQVGGVVIGVLISGLVYSVAIAVALAMANEASSVVAVSLALGSMIGAAVGVASGIRTSDGRRGALCGLLAGGLVMALMLVAFNPAVNQTGGMLLSGTSTALFYSALFALSYALAERIAGPWAGAAASAVGSGGAFTAFLMLEHGPTVMPWYVFPVSLAALGVGLAVTWWQPVALYPFEAAWNLLLYRVEQRKTQPGRSLLRWHSAFWDEFQRLPLRGLEEHLVLAYERDPHEGRRLLELVSAGNQRWAAQAAQVELDARKLDRCHDVEAIADAYCGLPAGELQHATQAILTSFRRISQDTHAALHQHGSLNQRLVLSGVERRLDDLLIELIRSGGPYAGRFRPIATRWRQVIAEHVRVLVGLAELRQEIENPYVVGVPLTEAQEIFVGRTEISARLARWLLTLHPPPILLYGQRRMGKTSLLNNLGRLLPSTIVPLFVDLQQSASVERPDGLLSRVASAMSQSASRQRHLTLPALATQDLGSDPYFRFVEWLDAVESALGDNRALLALDEFETLDHAFRTGPLRPEPFLGMLRHLIQHRPRFTVLIAGSHTLDEISQWANHLINLQTLRLDYLSDQEARHLIEHPAKRSSFSYEPEAVERILKLTRCHPYLIQLLCYQIVDDKNTQEPGARRLATVSDVEDAVPSALSRGSLFFYGVCQRIDAGGVNVLKELASRGEGGMIDADGFQKQAVAQLLRREIIEPVESGYRFQVELIRRWFSEREPLTELDWRSTSVN